MWSQLKRRTTSRGRKGFEGISQEEAELGFVPSAVIEPQRAFHLCDRKWREESFMVFQLAAVVTEEGGTAHTINLCKQCYNERRLKQGERPVKSAQWREMMGRKALCGKLWKAFGMEQYFRRVWEHFTVKSK